MPPLHQKSYTLKPTQKMTLSASPQAGAKVVDAPVEWAENPPGIVILQILAGGGGKQVQITGLSIGETKITATTQGQDGPVTMEISVKVEDPPMPDSIGITGEEAKDPE